MLILNYFKNEELALANLNFYLTTKTRVLEAKNKINTNLYDQKKFINNV